MLTFGLLDGTLIGIAISMIIFFFTIKTKKVTKNMSKTDDIITMIEARKCLDEEINRQIDNMGKLAKWRLQRQLTKRGLLSSS